MLIIADCCDGDIEPRSLPSYCDGIALSISAAFGACWLCIIVISVEVGIWLNVPGAISVTRFAHAWGGIFDMVCGFMLPTMEAI
jgi:hypothetical protein